MDWTAVRIQYLSIVSACVLVRQVKQSSLSSLAPSQKAYRGRWGNVLRILGIISGRWMISFRLLPPFTYRTEVTGGHCVQSCVGHSWCGCGDGEKKRERERGRERERETVLARNEPRGILMHLLTYCIKSSSLFYCHNRSPAYFLDASVSCCLDDLCRVQDGARSSGTYLLPCCTYQRRTTRLWWKACLVIRSRERAAEYF